MKISVIIRTASRPDFLKEALTSVYFQTHKDWEVLIFDDSAGDANFQIYKDFKELNKDKRVCYFTTATSYDLFKNSWLIAPDIAEGELMVRLDDDDLLADDALEFLSKLYTENPDLDFTYGSCARFNDDNDITEIMAGRNTFEAPKSKAAWAGYLKPNNHPWNNPWMFIENYYDELQPHTSLIHCSKENIMCVIHLYCMRTSSVKKVKDKIQMKSNHADDLEFFGSLDYLGLGHNSVKKVLYYLRDHTLNRVTNVDKKVGGVNIFEDIMRVRDRVDYLRTSGFLSKIIPYEIAGNFTENLDDNFKEKFNNYHKKIKEFGF